MGFKLSITDVEQIGERVWAAALTPAEIARLGTPAASVGERSVIGVTRPHFEPDRRVLSFDPGAARILNKGAQSTAIIVDLGEAAQADAPGLPDDDDAFRRGDDAFIDECRAHLPRMLAEGIVQIIADLRRKYPGHFQEGLARKWTNQPGSFVAVTIQPRDRSLAIHVKGRPGDFSAPSLDIRRDTDGYCRFKVDDVAQLADAGRVVQAAARSSEGS
jgi:hypothetical protein